VNLPAVWPALVLALAAFRLTRLAGWDDITASLRARATGLTDAEYNAWAALIWEWQQEGRDPWENVSPAPPVGRFRFKLAQLVRCPWCVGFWVSGLVYAAWRAESGVTLAVSSWFALSAIVGLVAKHLDK
jgi:hypothetical protein